MHINPRASQVIKNDQSPVISHVNKFLNSATSVKAVCEAIKRYAYPVTQVVFVNNSLRPRDTKLIVESIERHMPTMELLNFTQNEFGPEGGKNIAANLSKMNNLKVLTLSHCQISDRGLIEIFSALEEIGTVLHLDFSGNLMGKSAHFKEVAEKFEKVALYGNLESVVLDDNNLRGPHGEKILKSICLQENLQKLSLKNNQLGQQVKEPQAPICVLTSLLIRTKTLEYLDLANNFIAGKSAYCLAEGLIMNKSLKYVSFEANPLGKIGLSLVMRAKTRNVETNFDLNIKLTESESDASVDFKVQVFNEDMAEGSYSLDLTLAYDQLVLQKLTTIAHEVSQASTGSEKPFDAKSCFYQVKLDGKSKWEVPSQKTPEGTWDLGPEPKGNLVFIFTQDPTEYKKEAARLAKEAAAMDPAQLADIQERDPNRLKPRAKENITEQTVSRPVLSHTEFEHSINILIKNYEMKNFVSNEEAIVTTSQ